MRYYVIHPSGQRFGPADIPTLTQWAMEGRLAPTSLLAEETTGNQVQAHQVQGISFPGGSPGYAQPGYGQGMSSPTIPYSITGNPPQSGYGASGSPYSTPFAHNPYSAAPVDGIQEQNNANILITVSLGLNLFCCMQFILYVSVFCAIGGLILAFIAKSKGAPAGGTIAFGFVALAVPIGLFFLEQVIGASIRG